MKFALLYTMLAFIATTSNILTQAVVVEVYSGTSAIQLSVLGGTAVGLIIKYVLDKKYIFRFSANDAIREGLTFLLYVAMGVLTTLVFWGTEFIFHMIFEGNDLMRYLGGGIGLAIGYLAKYHLDKRFVFSGGFPCER